MIIFRPIGGIGNQLFGYSAARRLSIVSGQELVIDDVSGFTYDKKYKRKYQLDNFNISSRKATAAERMEPLSRVRRYVKRNISNYQPFEKRSYIKQHGNDFEPRLLTLRPKKTIYLEGYWQSEDYFIDVTSQIREDLQIVSPLGEETKTIAQHIGTAESIAVHVRFFDDPRDTSNTAQCGNNISATYYLKAVREMERLVPRAHFFVFSDQPSYAASLLPLDQSKTTLIDHNNSDAMAYADLWLMTRCKHFIIANSTFSWWGAWLSNNYGKKVIAPSFNKMGGKSSWGFNRLLPANWITV